MPAAHSPSRMRLIIVKKKLKDNELLIEKHKNELQQKDIELLQCKLKFYESHKNS